MDTGADRARLPDRGGGACVATALGRRVRHRGLARRGGSDCRGSRGHRPTRTSPRPLSGGLGRVVVGPLARSAGPTAAALSAMSITYLEAIREAQARALAEDPRVFIYGQDVGAFGRAVKATKNLAQEFPGRVIDSPISEDAMMGMAVGAAIEGMRPIIEMQFADFSTGGFNQIVNQASTLNWRTKDPCAITVRLSFGGTSGSGPFHSQCMEAIYAHYPGLIVMTPPTVEETTSMLLCAA